jgi:RND family efflux transporter MFP subunit
MRSKLKYILPPVVLMLAVITAVGMINSRKPAPRRAAESQAPLVRVAEVELQDYTFHIESQGTVTPRTEITQSAEVSGRILRTAPSFEPGGFFEKGDVLLVIDPLDYEAAVEQARVSLRQSERRLAEEEAQADIAKREWSRVGSGEPTSLTLREPQLAEARAMVSSASKNLEQAERNLDRTRIRAPYAGRIREIRVDLGQFVTRGTPVAVIYAVEYAEIRLPLPGKDLAFVDLPLRSRAGNAGSYPEVILQAELAGRNQTWEGSIVRTEGEIDPRTRLIYAVARVEDPYGIGAEGDHLPLATGLFVNARIRGRTVSGVAVLPRAALRGESQVLIIDNENRIRIREVDVLRAERDSVVIGGGLEPGERISVSQMDVVVDGMTVRIVEGPGA